jgi:hypothetical protein
MAPLVVPSVVTVVTLDVASRDPPPVDPSTHTAHLTSQQSLV